MDEGDSYGGRGKSKGVRGGDRGTIELGLLVCVWVLSHSAGVFRGGRCSYYSWVMGIRPDCGHVIAWISCPADDAHCGELSTASKGLHLSTATLKCCGGPSPFSAWLLPTGTSLDYPPLGRPLRHSG